MAAKSGWVGWATEGSPGTAAGSGTGSSGARANPTPVRATRASRPARRSALDREAGLDEGDHDRDEERQRPAEGILAAQHDEEPDDEADPDAAADGPHPVALVGDAAVAAEGGQPEEGHRGQREGDADQRRAGHLDGHVADR